MNSPPNTSCGKTALVLGASGFLGSHVIQELVKRGYQVRGFARNTSDCRVTAGLSIQMFYGDIADQVMLIKAMQGVDTVYHCVVNTMAWLSDVKPLYKVNVIGLMNALGAASIAKVRRFVLTSSFATIAPNPDHDSDESDAFSDASHLPIYIQCRIEAENLFFEFIRESAIEGVACCIANTYGANDIAPTPQGELIRNASTGRMPFYWDGGAESLGITDAAMGVILAAEKGRSGERYIFTDRWLSYRELFKAAAVFGGKRTRFMRIPGGLMLMMARVTQWFAELLRVEVKFNVDAIRCSNELPRCSNSKARHELGWAPRPVLTSVKEAVAYFHNKAPGTFPNYQSEL